MSCYFCDEITKIKGNQNESLIAELSETYVLLKSSKLFPGYCLVITKEHFEQLPELPQARQMKIFADVSKVAEAIYSELKPQRINYECLGNLVSHIHWHVIPRYGNDPLPEGPVWQIDKTFRDQGNETNELRKLKDRLSKKLVD